MCKIITPLNRPAWGEVLANHLDKAFVQYILRGIERGFRIGFNPRTVNLRSRYMNLISASEHPEIVGSYLEVELSAGRMIKMKATGEFGRNEDIL